MNLIYDEKTTADSPEKAKTDIADSLRVAFVRYGLHPDRIAEFIDYNMDAYIRAAESKLKSTNNKDVTREQLVIDDIQILRLLLGDASFLIDDKTNLKLKKQ